ncbi:MAG TPA: hypothetical protein V6C57_17885 [Coleofasciculaceae cyanobacterium]
MHSIRYLQLVYVDYAVYQRSPAAGTRFPFSPPAWMKARSKNRLLHRSDSLLETADTPLK